MSDFDKEAEREKLRKKFEDDREDRKHTQELSELLLKGATMTNRHCDRCGDPIFRHDGQEFCPTCGTGEEAGGQSAANAGTDAGGVAGTDAGGVAGTDAGTVAGTDAGTVAGTDAGTATGTDPRPDVGTGTNGRVAGSEVDIPAQPVDGEPDTEPVPNQRTNAAPGTDDADLAAARQSLARTVTTFAERAAATEDPRHAKEHLEAAREAAEALAALR